MAAGRARPDDRHQRRADPRAAHRASAAPTSTSTNGTPGRSSTIPVPMADRPRVRRRDRRGRLQRLRLPPRRHRQRRRPRRVRPLPQLPRRAAAICAPTRRASASTAPGAFAEYIALPMTNSGATTPHRPGRRRHLRPVRQRRAHCAVVSGAGEDVLITGAGPIGIMAAAVVRHAGARHVVITDVNPYRLELARKMGVTRARRRPRRETLAEVQKELGMTGGLRRRPGDVRQPAAFRDMLANMCHGGKIAMLGIPDEEIADRLAPGHLQHAHHQGHLRARDVETWYKYDLDAPVRPGLAPVITHRFAATDFAQASRSRPAATRARSSSTGRRCDERARKRGPA